MQNDQTFFPDFFITPRVIWLDQSIPPMAEKVYSVIYWYGRLKDGYCHASNATIAKNIGSTNAKSVGNAVYKLIEAGYIAADYDPATGERTALIPLIEYNVSPPSNDGTPLHQMMEHNKNNIEKISLVKKHRENIDKLYRGWLIEMVIGFRNWSDASAESKLSLLDAAEKKLRLTTKREQKLARALDTYEYTFCAKAIKNIALSAHHRGENDRGWKATLEWLFNTDEKVEEWANR